MLLGNLSAQDKPWIYPEVGALVDTLVARGLLGESAVAQARSKNRDMAKFLSEEDLPAEFAELTPTQWARLLVFDVIGPAFRAETMVRLNGLVTAYKNERLASTLKDIRAARDRAGRTAYTEVERERMSAVIEEEGVTTAEFEFEFGDGPSDPEPYLNFVQYINFQGDIDRPESTYAFIGPAFSVLGRTRRKLIDLVEEFGLAAPEIIARVRADLEAGLIGHEWSLVTQLTEGTNLTAERDTARAAATRYVDALEHLGILAPGPGLTKVREVVAAMTLRSDYEVETAILDASPRAVEISYAPTAESLGERYVTFLRKLALAVPALGLTDPEAHTRSAEGLRDREWDLALTYRLGGTPYRQEIRDYFVREPNVEYGPYGDADYFDVSKLIDSLFLHLDQQGVDLRFLYRNSAPRDRPEEWGVTLIPVTRREAAALAPFDGSPIRMFTWARSLFGEAERAAAERQKMEAYWDSQDEQLPAPGAFDYGAPQRDRDTVIALVKTWRGLGLLAGLSADEITASTERAVHLAHDGSVGSLLQCFPRRVVYFDWESAERDSAYLHLLREFERAGRGKFSLSNITDEFPAYGRGGPYAGSFELGGETYSFRSQGHGDWLDGAFLEALQQALGEQAIGGRFYMVIDDGQASGFAFFTDEETAALRAQMPGMIQEPERD